MTERSPLAAIVFRFANREKRRQMLGMPPQDGQAPAGDPAVLEISHDWQERIREKTRPGNQWLIDRWNLPLDKYGYPV